MKQQDHHQPQLILNALKEGSKQARHEAEGSDPSRSCHQGLPCCDLLHSFDMTMMPGPNATARIAKTESTSKMLHQPQLLRCPISQVSRIHIATLVQLRMLYKKMYQHRLWCPHSRGLIWQPDASTAIYTNNMQKQHRDWVAVSCTKAILPLLQHPLLCPISVCL